MTTEIEYESCKEVIYLDNAEFVKEQMEVLGWSCICEKIIDCPSGKIQLEFRRVKD
jgi:hypothetical protein